MEARTEVLRAGEACAGAIPDLHATVSGVRRTVGGCLRGSLLLEQRAGADVNGAVLVQLHDSHGERARGDGDRTVVDDLCRVHAACRGREFACAVGLQEPGRGDGEDEWVLNPQQGSDEGQGAVVGEALGQLLELAAGSIASELAGGAGRQRHRRVDLTGVPAEGAGHRQGSATDTCLASGSDAEAEVLKLYPARDAVHGGHTVALGGRRDGHRVSVPGHPFGRPVPGVGPRVVVCLGVQCGALPGVAGPPGRGGGCHGGGARPEDSHEASRTEQQEPSVTHPRPPNRPRTKHCRLRRRPARRPGFLEISALSWFRLIGPARSHSGRVVGKGADSIEWAAQDGHRRSLKEHT